MEPAAPGSGAKSRTKKKVMRALNIIGETAGIDQQSLEEYNKLFTGSARLPNSQPLSSCSQRKKMLLASKISGLSVRCILLLSL